MEDKDKEKKEEKEEKKEKPDNSQDEQLKQLEKEIENLLDDMKLALGDDNVPNIKIISAEKPSKKKVLLLMLIELLVSVALMVGLTGYIKWFRSDKLYIYFLVIFGIGLLDILGTWIINRFFVKATFYSFGTVYLVPKVVIFVLTGFIVPLLGTFDISRMIIVSILYIIIKSIIMKFIRGNKSNISFNAIHK